MKITVLLAAIAGMLFGCVLPPSRAEVYQKEMQQRDAAERERKAEEYREKQAVEKQKREEKERREKEHERQLLAKVPCKMAYLMGPAKAPHDIWDIDDDWKASDKKAKEMAMRLAIYPLTCTSNGSGFRFTHCSGYVFKTGLPVSIYSTRTEEDLILVIANIPMTYGNQSVLLKTKPEYLACP